jgi:hypothetical protein
MINNLHIEYNANS